MFVIYYELFGLIAPSCAWNSDALLVLPCVPMERLFLLVSSPLLFSEFPLLAQLLHNNHCCLFCLFLCAGQSHYPKKVSQKRPAVNSDV